MFNVVADQLKVSQGWVRCGQCSDVFDASLHLQDVGAAPPDGQAADVPKTNVASPIADAWAPSNQPDPPDQPSQPNRSDQPDQLEPPDQPLLDDDFERSLRAAVTASTAAKERDEEPLVPPVPATAAAAVVAPPAESRSSLLDDEINAEESAAAADGVSFVRHARRQAFWKKLWVRTLLMALATLLFLGLLLQIVLHQKDHLVLLEPRLKPVVQAVCEPLGCTLNPLKKIDAVVIDSSTFTKLGADSYKLSFSIKNLGAVAVAMPSLEVTLTDTQDQALLRRVLLPAQFGASAALLPAGSDFQGTVVLDVSAAALSRSAAPTNARVAGYRLLAFYP